MKKIKRILKVLQAGWRDILEKIKNKMLAFFDLDGTLMKSAFIPHPGTVEMLEKLKENGHRTFICTGRGEAMVPLQIQKAVDGMITSTGARCRIDGEVIFDEYFPLNVTKEVVSAADKFRIPLLLENSVHMAAVGEFSGGSEEERAVLSLTEMHFACYEDWLTGGRMEQIHKFSFRKEHLAVFKKLDICSKNILTVLDAGEGWIEVVYRQNTKGNAIRKVIGKLNWDKKDTICFGDSENDLSMFEVCQLGVAVRNAQDVVKEKAVYVIDSPDENEVAWAVSELGMV